jgi:MFS transporter, DHA1 family, inner membrane transport protein
VPLQAFRFWSGQERRTAIVTAQNTVNSHSDSARFALWLLLFGNLIIGTGVLLPAGILTVLETEFSVNAQTAGYLLLAGGIVVGIGAPLFAAFTSTIDRRTLLTFALMLYGAGHLASALVPDFWTLLAVRVVMIAGAAIFTPQAAATAGLLVPPERRAAAIGFIFIGWSSATVIGIPLGAYISSFISWRFVFAGMGVICIVAAIAVWRVLRPGLFVTPLNAAAWRQALTNPVILTVLFVTLLSMTGQFTVFSYIDAIIKKSFGGDATETSIAFAVAGVSGVIGNWIAARTVGGLGADKVIAIAICGLIVGLGWFALSFGVFIVALVGVALWGLGSFSSNSMQQSRLVGLAPALASATIALNTSVVYLGQALGAYSGGYFVVGTIGSAIAWSACGFTVLALLVSLFATRLSAGSGAGR